jgi:hypothetical protein
MLATILMILVSIAFAVTLIATTKMMISDK